MTTPEDRTPAPVDPICSEAARVARYAEALRSHRVECFLGARDLFGWHCLTCGERKIAWTRSIEVAEQDAMAHAAPVVVAVADEEHAALVAEVERLRKLLSDHAEDAYEDVAEWGAYASDYFTEKWNLAACLTKWGRRRDLNRADAPAELQGSAKVGQDLAEAPLQVRDGRE